jgi:pimeloyl-ACP methyl ester carboxylesterase
VTEGPQVVYLHGFASSPRSSKADYLAERLLASGVTMACPDFNGRDFARLTMTRMLTQLEEEVSGLPPGPVTLVGSSLGGTLAVLAAARLLRVSNVVLLAPAVMFAKPGHHLLLPERIEVWRREGRMPFFHYGFGEERFVDVAFYEDSLRYQPMNAVLTQPTLIYQGLRDASVDYRTVEQFARQRPHVRLRLVDDDHSLAASLPLIWEGVRSLVEHQR